jgi:aspartyl-tRNA(Asn)/glutamyl-tRNA(Gln) amidotransferase subunit B
MSYTPTIGLEVHAELNTKSKMFCGCKNEPHGGEVNIHICPVCMAHPGTLPVPNQQAIEMVLLFGQSVEATPATYSEFDRKNYFYPDIPKAYQISQYAFPFLTAGKLNDIDLTRVHLEEDTARSQHDKGEGSIVDFNRAGVPLMELVTEPVIHDSKTAGAFARELQLLLRTLDISKANMEKGEMRVEANISVSKNDTLGTKVEVKNLNSFKSVESAIEYEISRQIEALEKGEELDQETRGWDEVKLRTFTQRTKETAKDYRYFPDPDITKISVSGFEPFRPARLAEKMPILPNKKRELLRNLGLTSELSEVIIGNSKLNSFMFKVLELGGESEKIAALSANYLTSDVMSLTGENGLKFTDLKVEHFVELMTMLSDKKIGSRVAKDLLVQLFASDIGPMKMAEDKNLLQISDSGALQTTVDEIITENESVVAEYKAGKEASLQFLLGQGMKKTRGSADPALLKEMLIESLK